MSARNDATGNLWIQQPGGNREEFANITKSREEDRASVTNLTDANVDLMNQVE